MAGISRDKNGTRRILFYAPDGKQKAIYLGKCSQKLAEAIKLRVETLLTALAANQPPDAETAKWVSGLDTVMANKLAAVGLTAKRENATLGALLKLFDARNDVKPGTKTVWGQAQNNLRKFFGEDKKLHEVTVANAEDFHQWLIGQGLASWTIHKRLQFARMAFRKAVRRGLILSNPFEEVRPKKVTSTARQFFVSRDMTDKLLAVCDLNWQVILGLSRFGGLRCPSEVLSLRWVDVKWDIDRFVVWSPKTEHFEGKDHRIVPLFPELRVILERAYKLAQEEGNEYVVRGNYRLTAMGPRGWMNTNLRTQFQKIIKRAGLKPWPRLFHNMRASRETELVALFPVQVVTAWLGNTPAIAMRHYLQVRDSDFEAAARGTGTSLIPASPASGTEAREPSTSGRMCGLDSPSERDVKYDVTTTSNATLDTATGSAPFLPTLSQALAPYQLGKAWAIPENCIAPPKVTPTGLEPVSPA